MATSERRASVDQESERAGGATPHRGLSWLSVEPVVVATLFGLGLFATLGENLWLDKICEVHFNLSTEVCGALSLHPWEEEEVQRFASRYRVYSEVVEQVPGVVMVLLMGGYSDALDRRFPLLWCHVGFLLMALSSVANAYWWWLRPELLLLSYLLLGTAGSTLVFIMGVEAYVSAASAARHRTTRLMVLKVLGVVGVASGRAVALPVFHAGSYVAVFGLQSLVFASVIVYVLLRLERRPEEAVQQRQQGRVLTLADLKRTVLVMFQASGPGGGKRLLVHMCIVWLLLFSSGE